eukprot:2751294-Prymnesium_polylepis.1
MRCARREECVSAGGAAETRGGKAPLIRAPARDPRGGRRTISSCETRDLSLASASCRRRRFRCATNAPNPTESFGLWMR